MTQVRWFLLIYQYTLQYVDILYQYTLQYVDILYQYTLQYVDSDQLNTYRNVHLTTSYLSELDLNPKQPHNLCGSLVVQWFLFIT